MTYRSFGTNYPDLVIKLDHHDNKSSVHIETVRTEYPSVAIAYLGKSCLVVVGDCVEYRDCFTLANLEFDVMRMVAFKSRLDASIDLHLTMQEVIVLERRGANKIRYRLKNKSREELYRNYD